jgi:selenide, water dikinase
VGFEESDDAGVYRINAETAIVSTADFITPPVDDPFLFGQIAAANAISDVYAMGGRPLTCLNLVSFPSKKLAPSILKGIVEGALDKITEAGALLVGGHTVEDDEPKFGLAVLGQVHPDKIWRNKGAKAGDHLILTKPIGSGVIFNANLKGLVSAAALDACLKNLVILNKVAAETLSQFEAHAVTDVTGFGLAGHGFEMAHGSQVQLVMNMDQIPLMAEALEMYHKGVTTGSNRFNREMVEAHLAFEVSLPKWHREIVYDPQTSGGLLVSVAADKSTALLSALKKAGVTRASLIGQVKAFDGKKYLVFV